MSCYDCDSLEELRNELKWAENNIKKLKHTLLVYEIVFGVISADRFESVTKLIQIRDRVKFLKMDKEQAMCNLDSCYSKKEAINEDIEINEEKISQINTELGLLEKSLAELEKSVPTAK